MRVRSAGLEDADALCEVGAATFSMACPPNTPEADLHAYIESELTCERFRAHIRCTENSLYVAEFEGSIVGYLMLCQSERPEEVEARRPLELRRLYVLPLHHGTGVAAALMQRAIREAGMGGHDVLWLGVSSHNGRGISFYRKHGFSVVGKQRFAVGNDVHEDFIMARSVMAQPGATADAAKPRG